MFYDRFSELCKSRGISCNKAALEIGLSNATPTKWKKTGAIPTGETLERIASYFGVTTDSLLGAEDIVKEADKDFDINLDKSLPHIHPTNRIRLGNRLRFLRESRGLTLEQVGIYIGVGGDLVYKYEKGVIDIKFSIATKLSKCFDTSVSYIMGWTNDPTIEIIEKMPTPVSESGQLVNIVKIAGRDGSYVEKRLTDDQVKALRAIVDQFLDASDDL